MNELLTILKIVGLVWLGYRACKWAYFLGYGDAPRNVIEPVQVLSTGERPEPMSNNYVQIYRVPHGAGMREDLSDMIVSSSVAHAYVSRRFNQ